MRLATKNVSHGPEPEPGVKFIHCLLCIPGGFGEANVAKLALLFLSETPYLPYIGPFYCGPNILEYELMTLVVLFGICKEFHNSSSYSSYLVLYSDI